MLKEFRFSNFGSFRDEAVLSMEAVGLKELKRVPRKEGSDTLLPLAAIYGKNGGGKTNVLWAFGTAVGFICNAQKIQYADAKIPVKPFLLDDVSAQKPTTFDFVFWLDNVRYWYGFSATQRMIIKEYLYHAPKKQKALVFERDGQSFKFSTNHAKKKRELIRELVAENQLFLSIAGNTNDEDCSRAMRWFRECVLNGNRFDNVQEQIVQNVDNQNIMRMMGYYAKSADIGIENIDITALNEENKNTENLPESMPEELRNVLDNLIALASHSDQIKVISGKYSAVTHHWGLDTDGKARLYPLALEYESEGTHNLMALVPAIEKTLNSGGILVMDELENGLHPMLVKMLLSKFQNPDTNPKNAQIIFTTHSTELLDMSLLRKDQIYLADKSRKSGVSSLYSVSDFSTPTRENVRRAYLAGKYGAFPDIDIEEVE